MTNEVEAGRKLPPDAETSIRRRLQRELDQEAAAILAATRPPGAPPASLNEQLEALAQAHK